MGGEHTYTLHKSDVCVTVNGMVNVFLIPNKDRLSRATMKYPKCGIFEKSLLSKFKILIII